VYGFVFLNLLPWITEMIVRRTQTVVDANGKPLPNQTVSEGSLMDLTVHLPPSMEAQQRPNKAHLCVTLLDSSNHRVAWVNRMPLGLLTAERWQWLTVVEDGAKTKYETIEVFHGLFAYLVKWFVSGNLKLGFQAMADGLKARAESSYRA
jgi:hypothetical protein